MILKEIRDNFKVVFLTLFFLPGTLAKGNGS